MKRIFGRSLQLASDALRRGQEALADAERVCRFVNGRLAFVPRSTDVYVATYPRSGTTWVQFILYLLHHDGDPDFAHISQASPWFERSLALGTKQAEDFQAFADPRCFKTHLTPEWLPSPRRVIFIERNPLDVLLSYFYLYRTHIQYRGSLDDFVDRFTSGRLQYGSWFDHVDRWRRHAESHPESVLTLRYEELQADLAAASHRIASFMGVSMDREREARVRRMADISWMRAHQDQFDPITETLIDRGLARDRFIRTGRSGEGEHGLSEHHKRRLVEARRAWRPPSGREWRIHDFLH